MSIYTKPTNPINGSQYIDYKTGEIFVYLAGRWVNTFLSNTKNLIWVSDNSFICKEDIIATVVEDKITELGLLSIKKSRKLGFVNYTVEDEGEVAVFKLYFNDMFAN